MISFESTLAHVKRLHPDLDDEDARDLAHDWLAERARDLEQVEDSPCLEAGVDNCDDAGTGEGRWHGRV